VNKQFFRIRFFLPLALVFFLPYTLVAQSVLSMSDPALLAKAVNSKTEVERCIILATPESLAQAKDGLTLSKIIDEADKQALLEILRGINSILYPASASNGSGSRTAASALFTIDPSIGSIHHSYSIGLTQLVEASQGKIFAAPRGSESSFLNEILPALAIFRSQDQEVARNALAYAQRFIALPEQKSVIPGLVQARFERLTDQPVAAYYSYQKLLEVYPDLWPARLELGVISLELSRPVNALNFLKPLVNTRTEDPAFIQPYSIALYRNGKLAEAEPFIRKALEYFPGSDDLSLTLAHVLMDRSDYQAAQPLIDGYGRKHPSNRLYLYLKTQLSKSHGRYDDTLKWARKALQAYPGDPEIMILLAGVLFQGPESGHKEASLLCESALSFMAGAPKTDATGLSLYNPLQLAMRQEAEDLAERYLLMNAYNSQDWYAAADLMDKLAKAGLDKEVVATILRKSGRNAEALAFSNQWYNEDPASEPAIEAYLRSLAASVSGPGLAAAGSTVSDMGFGILGSLGSTLNAQPVLLGLAIQLLSGSASKEMRSYLYYLQGSFSSDSDIAIDYYRKALLERADNIEAIAALAKAYADKNDKAKALFYIKQARMVGIADQQIQTQLKTLEAKLNAPEPKLNAAVAESEAESEAAAPKTSNAPQSGAAAPNTSGALQSGAAAPNTSGALQSGAAASNTSGAVAKPANPEVAVIRE
jgi:Tfp pilus assembly protein PilF